MKSISGNTPHIEKEAVVTSACPTCGSPEKRPYYLYRDSTKDKGQPFTTENSYACKETKHQIVTQYRVDVLLGDTWQPMKSFPHKKIAMMFLTSLEAWGIHARVWC